MGWLSFRAECDMLNSYSLSVFNCVLLTSFSVDASKYVIALLWGTLETKGVAQQMGCMVHRVLTRTNLDWCIIICLLIYHFPIYNFWDLSRWQSDPGNWWKPMSVLGDAFKSLIFASLICNGFLIIMFIMVTINSVVVFATFYWAKDVCIKEIDTCLQ